jgi:hypothetical protein
VEAGTQLAGSLWWDAARADADAAAEAENKRQAAIFVSYLLESNNL